MIQIEATAQIETKKISRSLQKREITTLKSAAAYVRKVAQNSIKQRKNPNKASAPGTPPHSHPSSRLAKGFKKTIVFGVEKKVAVVGPKKVPGGLNELARSHEFGGSRKIKLVNNKFLTQGVSIGDVAPVRKSHLTKKDIILRTQGEVDPLTSEVVYWVKIRTKSQANHARRLYRRLLRHIKDSKSIKYPARPFMRPALTKSAPSLSRFWINIIK